MMILITGGAGSGKSCFAETLCRKSPKPLFYLAAMQPYGEEGRARVERHRAMRAGKGFQTVERYTDYASLRLCARGTALLECVGNLTANEMFDETGNRTDPYDRVLSGIDALQRQCERLVVVTNEIGSDGVLYDASTEAYIDALGRINAALAARADAVVEVVAGIPLILKGELPV